MTTHGNQRRIDEIHTVAGRLFRDKGYRATSMRDIAHEMQMQGGGSLYAHIKAKEDLLWNIATEAADAFFAALDPIFQAKLPPDKKLQQAIIQHVLVITEHIEAAAVYFDEWRHLGKARRDLFNQRRDTYEQRFQAVIEAGAAAGLFHVADARLAALHVIGSMNAIRHWFRPDGRLSAQEIAAGLADLLLSGLCDGG